MLKIKYLIGLFLVVLMFGCANQVSEQPLVAEDTTPAEMPTETPAETAPPELPTAPEPEPVETVSAGGFDVILTKAGFDPEELTVKAGSTVTWKVNDDNTYIIMQVGGFRSPKIAKGQTFENTFEKAGTYTIMDAVYKKSSTIIVE